jgi:GNAT superfamily N-acetyltransferase
VRLLPVESRRDLREFQALTDRLYGGDPRWVPPLREQLTRWLRGEVPGVRLCVLRDASGSVVARTTLHTDDAFDAKLGRAVQLFGLTEFVDADGVSEALFDAICVAGRRAGRAAAFGPVSLLPNQSGGVITSGYEDRGFIDSAWNHPSYPAAYERYGFGRRFEGDTWICPVAGDRDPGEIFAFDDARVAAEGLELHHGDKRRIGEQLTILREMLNASFAQLGYYTEISGEQLARQTEGLAYLLDESLLLFLTKAGRPIAFVLCLPDISEFVVSVRGNLNLPNQVRLLATRSRYRREAVLIIKGTVPDAQGHGYMRLLSRELLHNLRAGGYTTLRSTFVERSNPGSAAHYVAMGGRPLHAYTFYEKALA